MAPVLVMALAAFTVQPARAQPGEAITLVDQGSELLARQDYAGAMQKFQSAVQADPANGQAAFFQAVASNRLGQPEQALIQLEQARSLNFDHPAMEFEKGWALLNTGQYEPAIASLNAYEAVHPGRGQTLEFLGRAWFQLGDYEKSRELLMRAVERDSRLESNVSLYLALIDARTGREVDANKRLTQLAHDPESTLAQALSRFGLTDPLRLPIAADGRRWRLNLSVGAGWNSNVVAVADGVALPADISDKGSAVGIFGLSAGYDLIRETDQVLTVGYNFQGNIYEEGVEESDLLDHYAYLDYRRELRPGWTGSLRAANQYSAIGGNSFRNRVSIRPAVATAINDWLEAELAYSLAINDYFFDTNPVRDRDGQSHTVALSAGFRVPDTRLTGRIGYLHSWHIADGSDFDYDSDGVFVLLGHPLPWEMNVQVSYTHLFDDYDDANSFTAFTYAREDDVDVVSVLLTRPLDMGIGRQSRAWFRYDFTNLESNISLVEYDQHVFSAGVSVDF